MDARQAIHHAMSACKAEEEMNSDVSLLNYFAACCRLCAARRWRRCRPRSQPPSRSPPTCSFSAAVPRQQLGDSAAAAAPTLGARAIALARARCDLRGQHAQHLDRLELESARRLAGFHFKSAPCSPWPPQTHRLVLAIFGCELAVRHEHHNWRLVRAARRHCVAGGVELELAVARLVEQLEQLQLVGRAAVGLVPRDFVVALAASNGRARA